MRAGRRRWGRSGAGSGVHGSRTRPARPRRRGGGVLRKGAAGEPALLAGMPRNGPPKGAGGPLSGGLCHVQEGRRVRPRPRSRPRCKGPRPGPGAERQGRRGDGARVRRCAPPRLGGAVGARGMRPCPGHDGAARGCHRVVPRRDQGGSGRCGCAHRPCRRACVRRSAYRVDRGISRGDRDFWASGHRGRPRARDVRGRPGRRRRRHRPRCPPPWSRRGACRARTRAGRGRQGRGGHKGVSQVDQAGRAECEGVAWAGGGTAQGGQGRRVRGCVPQVGQAGR